MLIFHSGLIYQLLYVSYIMYVYNIYLFITGERITENQLGLTYRRRNREHIVPLVYSKKMKKLMI